MATPTPPRVIRDPKTRFNWRVSDVIRRLLVWWFEIRAKISGRGYYCSTLAGQEDYNLTINSDLTVSCNCQDYEGTGHIGDLRKNTFEEIYFGPVAQKFRDELARGVKAPVLEWKYLLFNWNDQPQHIARAVEMAKEIGVDIISFWPTQNPFYGMSWRYKLGLMKNIGEKCWKGHEIILRPENIPANQIH